MHHLAPTLNPEQNYYNLRTTLLNVQEAAEQIPRTLGHTHCNFLHEAH